MLTLIHFKLRKEPELIVGNAYYVSFGMNKAIPCLLLKIIDNGKELFKEVHIGIMIIHKRDMERYMLCIVMKLDLRRKKRLLTKRHPNPFLVQGSLVLLIKNFELPFFFTSFNLVSYRI